METERKCKKCGKILPDDYKDKLCEACLNKKAKKDKGILATVGTCLLAVVGFVIHRGRK